MHRLASVRRGGARIVRQRRGAYGLPAAPLGGSCRKRAAVQRRVDAGERRHRARSGVHVSRGGRDGDPALR